MYGADVLVRVRLLVSLDPANQDLGMVVHYLLLGNMTLYDSLSFTSQSSKAVSLLASGVALVQVRTVQNSAEDLPSNSL